MTFLFNKDNHFNLANLATFLNIASGIVAIYFLIEGNFLLAAIFAWIAGAFDIVDGKVARKFNLSTEFGVQLDSFADFFSFVIVPPMFLYFAIFHNDLVNINIILIASIFVYYIISGLRRLIVFNINVDAGEVSKYFIGVPTPLGAILLWIVYLLWLSGFINEYIVLALMALVGYLLNSKIKIKHL